MGRTAVLVPEFAVEEQPLGRTAAEFAVKDLPFSRTLIMIMMMMFKAIFHNGHTRATVL